MLTDHTAAVALAAKPGNEVAFERLIEPALEPAYRLACGMLHDPYAAEDAVQESAVKAWRKLGQLRDVDRLTPWFLGIVANECRSARRSRWLSVLSWAEPARPQQAPDESILTGIEVRRALRALDHDKRLVIVLRWYLDLSLEDISSVTGSSVHAVEARLYRGMNELRRRMEGRHADRT
jgi:RNA polymerase sigma factor (sigma-70 family)